MDYCLGAGDGVASIWSGHPDVDVNGDGELDGVRMDFDGDGLFDDALADLDGDGLADHAALDLDDDGTLESLHPDDGTGTWALTSSAGGMRWFDLAGIEHSGVEHGEGSVDFDGDGAADRMLDTNRDGLADRVLIGGDGQSFVTGYVDADLDGRWDVKLIDHDGDGAADGAVAL